MRLRSHVRSALVYAGFAIAAVSGYAGVMIPALTDAGIIRSLDAAQAARHLPVELEATVTYADPYWSVLFVQDASSGVFVYVDNLASDVTAGSRVKIRGTTLPGDFRSSIHADAIKVIGRAKLPEPVVAPVDELLTGRLDSDWAEVTGIVHSAREFDRHLQLDMVRFGHHFSLVLREYDPKWATSLINAEVRARGVVTTLFNGNRQITGVNLDVPSLDFLTIVSPGNVGQPPVASISDLGQFSPTSVLDDIDREIRVTGTVQAAEPDGAVISDGKASAWLVGCKTQPGAVLDVTGFSELRDYRRSLLATSCVERGRGVLNATSQRTARAILANSDREQETRLEDDMAARSVEGSVSQVFSGPKSTTVLLASGSDMFSATWNGPPNAVSGRLKPGSVVRLSGICLVEFDAFERALSFRLLLRKPADIAVISPAPLWNLSNAIVVVGGLVALLGAGLFWVFLLRNRVAAQTQLIRVRLQHEAHLKDRYRRLFEANLAGILTFTPNGSIENCNPAFASLLGGLPEDFAGSKLSDEIWPQWSDFAAELSKNGKATDRQIVLRRRDGAVVHALANGLLEQGESGHPLIQTTIVDLSSQYEAEAKLIEAKKAAETASVMKGQFLANMSHEIRTPLNGVLGMTSLALSAEISDEARDYLETARDSANHLLVLVSDILDFSKIEAGHLTLERTEVSVHEIVRNAARTLAVKAYEKNVELLCDIDRNVPEKLIGDPHRLKQVLLNLLGNAIKFTDKGEITVRAAVRLAASKCRLQIDVCDTGIGIPEAARKRIFEPFLQADGSTTRHYGGTGLGLSICKQIAALMGGDISISSTPGHGSTFSFTSLLEYSAKAVSREDAGERVLHGRKVVVSVQNAAAADLLRKKLTESGLACALEKDPAAALARVDVARDVKEPDPFVIVDLGYGDGVLRSVAEAHARLGSLPTVIPLLDSLTLRRLDGHCDRALLQNHVLKPLDLDELIKRLRDAAAPVAPVVEVADPVPESGDDSKLRVLLAEDNAINQRVACALLKRLGHSVHVAHDGLQALEAFKTARFDAILMDVQMPVMDGFEATAAIRALPSHDAVAIPIIALTAHAIEGYRDRCLAVGMDEYLTKPINATKLEQALESAAKLRQSRLTNLGSDSAVLLQESPQMSA